MKPQTLLQPLHHTLLFIIIITIVITALSTPVNAVRHPTLANGSDFIRTSCNTTLYPTLCYTALSRYSVSVQQNPAQLARVAIAVSLSRARHAAAHFSNLSRQAEYSADSSGAGADPLTAAALHDCLSNFGDAVEEIRGSLRQMRHMNYGESFRFQMSNVQTWMSAALTDQETCTDGFDDIADGPLKSDAFATATEVKHHTSNALALVNSYADKAVP